MLRMNVLLKLQWKLPLHWIQVPPGSSHRSRTEWGPLLLPQDPVHCDGFQSSRWFCISAAASSIPSRRGGSTIRPGRLPFLRRRWAFFSLISLSRQRRSYIQFAWCMGTRVTKFCPLAKHKITMYYYKFLYFLEKCTMVNLELALPLLMHVKKYWNKGVPSAVSANTLWGLGKEISVKPYKWSYASKETLK